MNFSFFDKSDEFLGTFGDNETAVVRYSGQVRGVAGMNPNYLARDIQNALTANGWGVNSVSAESILLSTQFNVTIEIIYICAFGQNVDDILAAVRNAVAGVDGVDNIDLRFAGFIGSCAPTSSPVYQGGTVATVDVPITFDDPTPVTRSPAGSPVAYAPPLPHPAGAAAATGSNATAWILIGGILLIALMRR